MLLPGTLRRRAFSASRRGRFLGARRQEGLSCVAFGDLGTDVDVFLDRTNLSPRLESEDWEPGGPCAELLEFLDEAAYDFGFFRPYRGARSGYLPEPWHWSHQPMASAWLHGLTDLDWPAWLRSRPYRGSEIVLAGFEELFPRYALTFDSPPV